MREVKISWEHLGRAPPQPGEWQGNQRRLCRGSGVLTETWRIYCVSKRRGQKVFKAMFQDERWVGKIEPLTNWEVRQVWIVECETGRLKSKQRGASKDVLQDSDLNTLVVPFTEISAEEVGLVWRRLGWQWLKFEFTTNSRTWEWVFKCFWKMSKANGNLKS